MFTVVHVAHAGGSRSVGQIDSNLKFWSLRSHSMLTQPTSTPAHPRCRSVTLAPLGLGDWVCKCVHMHMDNGHFKYTVVQLFFSSFPALLPKRKTSVVLAIV